MRSLVLCGAFGLLLVVGLVARAKEEPVSEDKIPKAVMDALKSKFPQAKIDKCIKEKEGDDVIYDIEFKQEGRKCEADIKENGTYLNHEKAIAAKDLPQAVRDAVEKRYPKAKLDEVMEETAVMGKAEKLVAYEIVVTTAEKKEEELKISPDGRILEDTGAK
jgi:hypothetical protein